MPAKTRILVACSIESGSDFVARALSGYLGIPLIDDCDQPQRTAIEDRVARLGSKPFVMRSHLHAAEEDLKTVRAHDVSVVYLWRNLGDTIASLDDRIERHTGSSFVPYVHACDRYRALPPQHRYAYLIDQTLPSLTAFFLSWRDTAREFPIIRGRYEHLSSDPRGFFEAMLDALGIEPDDDRVERALDAAADRTRLVEDIPGRSKRVLSDTNQRRVDDALLRHPEDVAELWAELPWRSTGRAATGSILTALAGQPYNARAGTIEPSFPGLQVRTEKDGFWIHVPGALIAPSEGRTARLRLIVRGDAGPVFRLAWDGGRMETERRPGEGPAIVEFCLDERHANVPAFQLDCFNGSKRRGTGEILECVKVEA